MVSRKDVVFVFGALFWLYFSYANVFLNGWITFFVKMYNVVVNGILDKIGNVNGLQVDEVSDAYDVLIELVTFFNESMGFRVLVEVTVNICWTLGCTYFGWVYWKIGEYGGTVTNLLAAYLAIHTLYIYGNEAENLEQSRMKLVTKLSQIKIHGLNDVESKKVIESDDFVFHDEEKSINSLFKVVCLTQKVINCKLLISPGNFFTLNRSFVLSVWQSVHLGNIEAGLLYVLIY